MRPFIRLTLAVLFALMAAAAVGCGQDAVPPPSAEQGATPPSESPAATPLPTEESAAAATGEPPAPTAPEPTSPPSRAATATPQAVAPQAQDTESGSLRVIGSRSAAWPSSSSSALLPISGFASLGGFSGFDLPANPQTVPTEGGLTVSALGSVTVAADEAYVVIVPERIYSSSGMEQMTDEDRQQIRENLAEAGISVEAVEFEDMGLYGPSSIAVEVALDQLADKREQILDAVESVVRRYESYGVLYVLTEENCDKALSLARREAIPRAKRAADDLAEALEVSRGAVIGALEYPLTGPVYGLSGFDIRACGAQSSSPYPSTVPFDAEPQVEVVVGLQITYGLR